MFLAGPAALALLLASAGPRLEATLGAGAGYDTNLDHRSADATGAASASARAVLGAWLDLDRSTRVYAGVRADGEGFPEVPGLSGGALGVHGAAVRDLGRHAAIVLLPHVARSWWVDSNRNANALALRASLRMSPAAPIALRLSTEVSRRIAEHDAYSADRWHLGGSVDWRVAPGAYLSLGYAHERGHEVYYVESGRGTTGGFALGPTVGTFGRDEKADPAIATSRIVVVALELPIADGQALELSHRFAMVSGEAGDFQRHSTYAGFVLRY
jgi:hypothetical protein